MKKIITLIPAFFILTGCAKIAHMQELLTLKRYSQNKDIQAEYVKQQDEKFEKLLAEVDNGRIENYGNQKAIKRSFGDPVFIKDTVKDDQDMEMWLYRYAVRYFDSPKVYLYFNEQGELQDWEKYIPQPKEESSLQESDDKG